MSKATRLSVEQRANLVAYLDGELDDHETKAIEETLAGSPAARRDVEMLSRAWDMLDLLPQLDPGEEFTQRTITRLHTLDQVKAHTQARWRVWGRRSLVVVVWLAALSGSVVAGVMAAVHAVPSQSRVVIEDFPVVEKLHEYEAVGDIEFLQELKKRQLFLDEPVDTTEAKSE